MTAAQRFSCTPASLQRGEPIAGTATHVRTWLLLEHSGPWGQTALRDARLPDGLGAALQQMARLHKAKVLLIRRPRSARDPERLNVFAAYSDPVQPRLEHGTVADAREVLDLDLGALRNAGTTGLGASRGPIFCVCTHGRHDACCAEFGRPAALALHDAHPDLTWEVSHIGGDRFAGNLLVLPDGLYYGRLVPGTAVALATRHRAGHLDLSHLRGRSGYGFAVQAAEWFLRSELEETGRRALRLEATSARDMLTEATFAVAGRHWRVRVARDESVPTLLTCGAERPSPIPVYELVRLERLREPARDTGPPVPS